MKRTTILILLLLLPLSLWSVSLFDMLDNAKELSQDIKRYEISLAKTLGILNSQDASTGLSLKVNQSTLTWNDSSKPLSFAPSMTLAYTTEDDVSLGLDASANIYLDSESKLGFTGSAAASVAKTFDLSALASSSDLTKAKNRLQAQLSYDQSIIRFETAFYKAVQSIIKQQSAVNKAQDNLNKLQKSLDDGLLLGTFSDTSLSARNARLQIELAQNTLSNSSYSLQSLLDSFKRDYGFDFETPDDLEDPEVEYDGSVNNTTLAIAKLEADIAQASYDEATLNQKSLSVQSRLVASDNGIQGQAGVSYKVDDLSLGLVGNLGYSNNSWSPSLTVSGSYNTNVADQTTQITNQNLENELVIAQMDYQDSLWEASQNASGLLRDVDDYRIALDMEKKQLEYVTSKLEQQKTLFDLGLVTSADMDDAQSDVDDQYLNLQNQRLEGLILNNEIRLFCL